MFQIDSDDARILALAAVADNISAKEFKFGIEQYRYSDAEFWTRLFRVGSNGLAKKIKEGRERIDNFRGSLNYTCIWEPTYPAGLRDLDDPPICLFFLGNPELLHRQIVGVVGSRKVEKRYLNEAARITEGLVKAGLVVVSGMAYGIDTEAHRAAFQNTKESTIAVLASDVFTVTPPGNLRIYNSIIESGGVVISEVLPGKGLHKGSFPKRNRIIAALSEAVVVISAPIRSGALITARQAFGLGRQVFTLPGSLDDPLVKGNHFLMKSLQAELIEDFGDLKDKLGLRMDRDIRQIPLLSSDEISLLKLISSAPVTIDNISSQFDKPIGYTLSLLTKLSLKQLIGLDSRMRYYRI